MNANIAAIRPLTPLVDLDAGRARELLRLAGVTDGVALLGLRGYVSATTPDPSDRNQYGVYDDALVLVTPDGVTTYLGNTDPSTLVPNRAVLQPGKYRYKRGTHNITKEKAKQYPAWVQAGGVNIKRAAKDGRTLGELLKGQWIGCNIHNGSWTTTGSAACQTVVPEQWKAFDAALAAALKAHNQDAFWYVLTGEW